MGPTYKIAELLKISPIAAAAYCEQVRKLSGLGSKLTYKAILGFLVNNIRESPSPQRMVEIIQKDRLSREGAWQPNETHLRHKKHTHLKLPHMPKVILGPSFTSRERLPEEKLAHCPHGVPRGRICAICEPVKFREQTGID